MTVEKLQSEMSRWEFVHWIAYFDKHGMFGWRRDDWNHALTRSEIARANTVASNPQEKAKREKALHPKNHLLRFAKQAKKKRKKPTKKQLEKMEREMEKMFASIATRTVHPEEQINQEVSQWQ